MDDKIIESATKLFLERGIKGVSMDDVAQTLGMSKRTLYEHFSSKDELLVKCMEFIGQRTKKEHESIGTEGKDCLQIFFEHLFLTIMQLKKVSIAFLQDISRVSKPGASSKFIEEKECRRHDLAIMIQKGQEEGYFRKDINPNLMISIFTEQSQTVKEVYATGNYTMEDIFMNVFVNYMRGACTIKGVQRVDELIEEYYSKNQ